MKRVALAILTVAVLAVGVDTLAELTQDRPDPARPGSQSAIVLRVSSRERSGSALLAAQGLWGACQGTVRHRLVEPGVVDLGDGRFYMSTQPALGEHSWRRLQGCLEDATLDRVKASVVSRHDIEAPAAPPT